jgi:capsular exopolysaccharide synthesis family protein
MEIRQYLEPLIKWWKLILVACVLAGISSYVVISRQPPIYQTRASLVIGRAVYEPNPSGGELGLAQQLASYYANIAEREVVRNATMEALGLPWLPSYTSQAVPNSQIIEIIVTDTDRYRAQAVANELANQLIKQSPSNPDLREQQRQEFIRQQLELLETQIQDTQDEIAEKENELGSLNSARQIADAQADLAALRQKLLTLQSNYANLLSNSLGRAPNSLNLLEPAALPNRPIGPNRVTVILMSIVIAFLISAGAAYLIEYLDDAIETAEEINRVLKLPVIGFIPEINRETDKALVVAEKPRSLVAEAFRALKVSLDFAQTDAPARSFLVASVSKTEGKSMIASNLALTYALAGKKVILVDADLRRPSLHTYLKLPNEKGLATLLLQPETSIQECIHAMPVENLSVITAGEPVPNASDLIGSPRMKQILSELEEQADYLIVDGPPILVTDSSILSTEVDEVLIVVGYGLTRRSEAVVALKRLESVGAKIAGVVLNRIPRSHRAYYRLYHYDYGLPAEETRSLKLGKLRIPLGFSRAAFKTRKTPSSEGGKTGEAVVSAADETA